MVKLGYGLEHNEPVEIPEHHLIITGATGEAGKTTALEGLISRWKTKVFIVFRTKRGELEFEGAEFIMPFFKQPTNTTMWQYVEGMIQATLDEKNNRILRSTIMEVCSAKKNLDDIHREIKRRRRKTNLKSFDRSMLTQLDEYFKIMLPELKKYQFQQELLDKNFQPLRQGHIYVMDLVDFSTNLQNMVIGATINEIMKVFSDFCVVLPEAWKYVPNGSNTPAKAAIERMVKEGRSVNNFVLMDSQDIVSISPAVRKNLSTWILGKQPEAIEAKRTVDELPLSATEKPAIFEVQRLQLGQFIVVAEGKVTKTFAQPAWMKDFDAIECARNPELAKTHRARRIKEIQQLQAIKRSNVLNDVRDTFGNTAFTKYAEALLSDNPTTNNDDDEDSTISLERVAAEKKVYVGEPQIEMRPEVKVQIEKLQKGTAVFLSGNEIIGLGDTPNRAKEIVEKFDKDWNKTEPIVLTDAILDKIAVAASNYLWEKIQPDIDKIVENVTKKLIEGKIPVTIKSEQVDVTVTETIATKPFLDEGRLEGKLCVLIADGFFDKGKSMTEIHGELDRRYPDQIASYETFRKGVGLKTLQSLAGKPYEFIKKDAAVWVITQKGKDHVRKKVEEFTVTLQ